MPPARATSRSASARPCRSPARCVVTTPQTVSLADTRRAVRMYQKLNVPTLGLIENMSHFVCPSCRHESDIFGKGGGETLAQELNVPFLGRIPIYEPIRIGGDTGVPIAIGEPRARRRRRRSSTTAEQLAAQLSIASYAKKPIPLTQVER